MAPKPPTNEGRRTYIDWARGVAVLIMIEAHVLDAWTLDADRRTQGFGYLNVLGGFAAPLFLWLAGLSLGLAAEWGLIRTGSRSRAAGALVRRGFEIFVLAFVFRLQSFVVSPGNPLVSLLRVDILNIMGLSMMGAALIWWLAPGGRSAALCSGLLGGALAMLTPLVRTAPWLGSLPPFLQWYLAPIGNHSTFTLFPWAGFVFAGTAVGSVLSMTDRPREGRMLWRIALWGGLLASGSYYASTRASIYAASSFWTTSPAYFGVRVGLLMVALTALFALTPLALAIPRGFGVLARFGRHSLFVYWVHVELVYGYATALVHHRLPLWINGVAYLGLVAFMYWSIDLKYKILAWWSDRPTHRHASETLGV